MTHSPRIFATLAITVALSACATETYDSGDGSLSYLRADFCEAHTVAAKQIDRATTDAGDALSFDPYATANWATTPDSVYRALIYYNKVGTTCEAKAAQQVHVLEVFDAEKVKEIHTDPVVFESAWMSENKRYLNLGFAVKTGQQDNSQALQQIGMLCDSIVAHEDGSYDTYLRLYHNQNGVPEYYSAHTYTSVPMDRLPASGTIHLTVCDYDGPVTKTLDY